MSWPTSLFVAAVTGLVAAAAAGVVAFLCVDGFQIPSREGASTYFGAEIAVAGGLVGFCGGLILSRLLSGPWSAVGIGSGAMLALAGIGALIAWSLADIPPSIGGRELDLVVEVRLPKGAAQPVAGPDQHLSLVSRPEAGQPARASRTGDLEVARARMEDGRWILPGRVFLFTSRGRRELVFQLGPDRVTGFEIPLPRLPGRQCEGWSGWQPPWRAPGEPWPDTEMSYRFRIEEVVPEGEKGEEEAKRFAALNPSSPLEDWFRFYTGGRDPDRDHAIAGAAAGRERELVLFLRSPDSRQYQPAFYSVQMATAMSPEVHQALREVEAELEAQLRKYTATSPREEGHDELGQAIAKRFVAWARAWSNVRILGKQDGRPEMETLRDLAATRKESRAMQSIVDQANMEISTFLPPVQGR